MRNERKRKRSFLARFMVFMMIINLLSGVNPSVVRAEENVYFKNGDEKQENGITISKNIVKYDNKTGVYDIELKVKGSSEKIQETKPLDVVLVMDTSKNMEKVIANAKEAARNVVDKLITNNTAKNVKMSIVSFADKGKKEIALTDNVNALKSVIAKLNAAGGAFTQHGIEVASDILNNAPADHKKVMILVSNGEPNIANGIHPDFGEKEKKFKRIFDPSEKSDGYEQWYGNIYYWHGKGYNKDERNYLVWLRNGLFGNGTKETQGKGHISWPYELMDEYFNNATIKAAEKIKQNTEIITVGIGIKDNRLAKLIMNNLATNGKYLETNSTGSELDKLLDSIAEKFKNKVYEGVITDPMSEYVDYVEGTASLEGSKKDAVLVFENNKLKVTNVVLGDKEELTLKYQVKLKDNWKDGAFHDANGETTLTPTPKENPMMFNVPKLRADATYVSIKFEKKWIGGVPTGVGSVDFILNADGEVIENINPIKVSGTGWTTRLENLPKYKGGKEIKYTATEKPGKNYEFKGGLDPQVGADGNITFTATNQNTEKVDITVTKKWVNTPNEYKDNIKVAIYSKAEGETEFKKGETKTLSKLDENNKMTLFTNHHKYNEDGKLIEYKVEEEGTYKEGKLKIGDHSFKVDVEQSKNNNYDWTITNTCDPINEMIEFKLVKVWDAVPDESVKPKFTIKATADKFSSSSSITLPIKEKEGYYNTQKSDDGKTWTTKIQALKYYKNNTPIKYTIEEEKLNGYESTFNVPKEIGDNDTVTFTNKRTMGTLTLEKKWVGDEESITGKLAEFTIKGGGKEISFSLLAGKEPSTKDTKLPVYDSGGKPIEYTITEEKIEGYDADSDSKQFTLVDGDNKPADKSVIFTNTKMLDPKKPFTVHKTWNGKPAKSVSFGLFADENSKPEETIKLMAGNTQAPANKEDVWTKTFTIELPEYKLVNGEVRKITYVVKELNEKGEPVGIEDTVILEGRTYKVVSNFDEEKNTFNFFNTDITTGEITYTKEWKGAKSDKAKFGLFVKDGNDLVKARKGNDEIPAVSANEEGKIIFKDVDLANHSTEDYVVRELNKDDNSVDEKDTIELNSATSAGDSVVKKYQVTYDDANRKITNTELIDITVTKTWGENVPQSEQQSVTVGVFKTAGTEPVKVIELKGDNWTGKFEDLPYVEGGYQVKETKINNVAVNDNLKKLYIIKIENGENIKATRDNVKITNDFNLAEVPEGKLKVFKQWTVEPKPITISLFTNEKTPTGNEWRRQDLLVTPNDKERVLEAEFDKPAEGTEFEILETAIGDVALSEDAIKSILNDENNYPTQYKIDDYDVRVHEINNNVFFIKNTNDKLLTEITVIKHWSDRTPAKYIKPVKVQLYVEESDDSLMAVGKPVELSDAGDWTYTFNGLDKKSGKDERKYHIAEVGEGKESVSLAEINEGYKLGNYNVKIREDLGYVSIANDVNLIDITAKKVWDGQVAANKVEFSLYKKTEDKLEFVERKTLSANSNWKAVFEVQGEDDNGKIEYQIFETAIDGVKINIDPTADTGYKNDGQENISYSTGTIHDGSYSVVITGNSKDNNFVVKNSFTRNPVLPVIPGGDTPGGTPVIPVVTPDPLPTPTPNPSTPVVDVPDDSTPQGPSSPGNNSGEDGNTNGDEDDGDNGFEEIDEDEVPQDGNIDNTDDADDADDNNEEETTDIADNKAPKGTPKLPKTGGETGDFLSIIGLGLIGLGLVIRRRR